MQKLFSIIKGSERYKEDIELYTEFITLAKIGKISVSYEELSRELPILFPRNENVSRVES